MISSPETIEPSEAPAPHRPLLFLAAQFCCLLMIGYEIAFLRWTWKDYWNNDAWLIGKISALIFGVVSFAVTAAMWCRMFMLFNDARQGRTGEVRLLGEGKVSRIAPGEARMWAVGVILLACAAGTLLAIFRERILGWQ